MFGSSIALGSGVPIVPRGRGFENEEQELDSRSRILCGLDDLGVGEWILEDTAGGCHVFALYLQNGSGDYVYVSDSEGPVSWCGSADDFTSGAVLVGLYVDYERGGDYADCYEAVYITEGFDTCEFREFAIVDAVRRVFDAIGFTAGTDGIEWGKVARLVLARECEVCHGSGVNSVGWECHSCAHRAEAEDWLDR